MADYALTPVGHDPFADPTYAQHFGLPDPADIARPPTLSAYTPSLSERMGAAAQSGLESLGASRGYAQGFGHRLQDVAGLVPGVGQALSAYDAGRAGAAGDYSGAALAALGALPMVGGADNIKRMAGADSTGVVKLFRGEYAGNKGGHFYTPDMEFARNFTQSGQDKEILQREMMAHHIYEPPDTVYAGEPDKVDAAITDAKAKGFKGVRLSEGDGEPQSVFVFDKSGLAKPGTLDPKVAPAADTQATAAASAPMIGAGVNLTPVSHDPFAAEEAAPRIIAYHGSPHSFDKFDTSKIGTGEGAQAYGHGLYFADNEGVAKSYRDALTVQNKGVALSDDETREPWYQLFNEKYGGQLTSPDGMVLPRPNDVLDEMARGRGDWIPKDLRDALAPRLNKGSMYQVAINANPDHFLDWDKPLSEQHPAVQQALSSAGVNHIPELRYSVAPERGGYAVKNSLGTTIEWAKNKDIADQLLAKRGVLPPEAYNPNGQDIYEHLATRNQDYANGSDLAATQALQQAGIPGIKYLDAGSRGPAMTYDVGAPRADFGPYSNFTDKQAADDHLAMLKKAGFHDAEMKTSAEKQSRNYVVFNDKTVDILKKYGIAGLMGAAGLSAGAHVAMTPVEGNPFDQQGASY